MHTSLRVTGALSGVESSVVLGLGLRWRTSSEAVHQAAFVVPAHPRRGDVLQVGERPNWPRSVLYSLPSCASRRTRIAAVDNTVRNERAHPEAGRKRDAMRAKTRAEADAQRPRGRGLSGSMPGHPLDLDRPQRVTMPLPVPDGEDDSWTRCVAQLSARAYGTEAEFFPNMGHSMMLY
jgi:hypothetical protein